ncbi:Hypothetical predicted protein [Xyrichtys novacula]|uniref:Uncharacterized protein n=1 Tax=Xyrichtys novacula TaxID=13765 RepID=A0AAV1GCL1_XYRNO|nr:Hypothetical predicted protein [Xyrichtys novacula]
MTQLSPSRPSAQVEVGMLRYGSKRIRKHLTMRMRRKTKRKKTKAKVVFCSRDMAAMAESEEEEEEEEEEEDEEEDRATKCPPAEYSREERAEVKGSPSIIREEKREEGAGQQLCSSHKGRCGIVFALA